MLINFHIPKCLKYILLCTILDYASDNIFQKEEESFTKIFSQCLDFFSQIFAVILYLYQKYILKRIIQNKDKDYYNIGKQKVFLIENEEENKKKKKIKNIDEFFILGYYIFLYFFIITFQNQQVYFYSFEMKKHNFDVEYFFLFIFCILTEKYLLNFYYYRHHFIAIGLNFLSLIVYFYLNEINLKIMSVCLIILIQILTDIIEVFCYSIIKKMNQDYFINMNLIIFIQGIIGSILTIIYYFLFKDYFNYTFPKFTLTKLIIIIIYIIIRFFFYIFFYRIIEETRTSYVLGINQAFEILDIIIKLLTGEVHNIKKGIIINFLSILSFCLFFEIITLNFCELDKYTIIKTSERGDEDFNYNLKRTNDGKNIGLTVSSINDVINKINEND